MYLNKRFLRFVFDALLFSGKIEGYLYPTRERKKRGEKKIGHRKIGRGDGNTR